MDSAKVLIVEDETIIALEIKGRLESLGYTVVAAVSSGEKAIQKAKSEQPDLVLMDMRLKGKMDGIESAGIIRSQYDIPVVFLTAYLDDDRLERAKLAMPFGYLLKPVKERELKVSIEMALYTAQIAREQQKMKLSLDQRVKELECFYGISRLAETPNITLNKLLKGIILLIAQSWQYPEVTHSRIVLKDGTKIICPHGQIKIHEKWSQSVDIKIRNKKIGVLIVFYSEERPQEDEGVFLKEERYLLDSLGERIGNLIERFEIQKELIDTEKTLQFIIKSSSNIFYAHTTNHVLTYLSPQIEDVLGYKSEEALVKWTDLITDHPNNKNALKYAQQAIDTGTNHPPFEMEFRHKSGQKILCEIRAVPMLVDGKTVSVVGSVTDITARREAENTLRSSEKRYLTILETAPIGVQISDLQGKITFTNTTHQKIHNRNKKQILGKHLWAFNSEPLEQAEQKNQYLRNIQDKKEHATAIYRNKTADGEPVDFMVNRCNLFNEENNEIEEVCTFITDVTSIKKSEKALREQEEKYRTLFELESDCLALIEVETGNILEVNKSFLDHYGYSRQEVLSMKNTDFSAEPEKTQAATKAQNYLIPIRWHKKKNETIFPVEIVANNFEYKGKKVHIAAIRDISLRIKAEEQIKASLKEKEILLQEIHHRVKNNMAVITSLINLQSSKTTNKTAKKILRDSQNRLHAMSLVHEFLHQSENLAEINVKEYLSELILMIQQSFGTAALEIGIEMKIEDHTINADLASPIGLIVNELITNSFKYAFPETTDGLIKIVYKFNEKQDIKLLLIDNGIGLPNDFNWKTLDTLGLSLVNTLVENQLDGSFSIKSNKGTTCTIIIPGNSSH